MKKYLNISLILTCIILMDFNSEAQVTVDSHDSNWIQYSRITSQSKRLYDDEVYQGDVYLFDEWMEAEFILPDDSKLSIDSLKLNLLRGHVEIFLKGKHLQLRGSQFNSFRFLNPLNSDAIYKSKHFYFDNGIRLPGIVKTIELENHSVLVAYKTGVRKVSQENPLMIESLKKDIVRVSKYRYIEKDGHLTRIKNKKDLQKYFGSSKEIKKFISKNKISHKEESDLAKVIAYASSN